MNLRLLCASAVLLAASLPAAAVDVGVSIQISEPGVYGRIDLGRFPQPQLIVTQPVIIHAPQRVVVRPEPVYMWVPRSHRQNWRRYCADYGACAAPVVFVRHDWYDSHVRPRGGQHGKDPYKHDKHDGSHGKGRGNDKHKHGRDD